jgi:KipI family sensor histidine kinase inhibitor
MNWISYGPRALLFRFADKVGEEALAIQRGIVAELEHNPPEGLIEFVPAFTTILLEFDARIAPAPAEIADELLRLFGAAGRRHLPPKPVKEIPVRYDGEDLPGLAKAKGMSVSEVCERHCAPIYRVYMLGFSPGFPYLGDVDPRLHAARLASPRRNVRTGSVAIGGEHTGIYTVESPGGWHVIGHTPVKIFDPSRGKPNGPDEAMFWLKAGDRVKFKRVDSGPLPEPTVRRPGFGRFGPPEGGTSNR